LAPAHVGLDDLVVLCKIVELRRYTLRPGARDTLVELFDRELVDTQEAVGMAVLGQFRDLDDPDAFVWLRGFPDLDVRPRALGAFYGGPTWAAHRDAANATMIASDDVLLLRAPAPIDHDPRRRAVRADAPLVTLTVHHLPPGAAVDAPPGTFVTEHAPNTFPALPVREDAEALVGFGAVPAPPGTLRTETFHLTPTSRSVLP
jgi:hypothetical protein